MTRTTQDERFVAAVGDELERRVLASRARGAASAHARRPAWVTAVASVAVLAIVAVVTAGLVGLRHDGAADFGAPTCTDGGSPIAAIGCGEYRVVSASDHGSGLPWIVDDSRTVSFRSVSSAAHGGVFLIEPGCDMQIPVRASSRSTITIPGLGDGEVACGRVPTSTSSARIDEQDSEERNRFLLSFFSHSVVQYALIFNAALPSDELPTLLLTSGAATMQLVPVTASTSTTCSDGGGRVASFGCADYRIVRASADGRTVAWPTHPAIEFRSSSGALPEQGPGCSVFSLPVSVRATALVAGAGADTRIACPVTGGGEAAWMTDFWSGPVRFALQIAHGQGLVYVLTSGSKSLRIEEIVPVATSTPAPTPTTPPSVASTAIAHGCPTTSGKAPSRTAKGTMVVLSTDLDGDGRSDTEWAQIDAGGMRIGVTTASGATISRQIETTASDPSLVIGAPSHDVAPVLVGDGHGARVFAFVHCAIVPTLDSGGTQLVVGAGGRTGTGVGCSGGHLVRYQVTGQAADPMVEVTTIDLSADGRTASVGSASIVGRNLDPKAELITIARAVTCRAVILHPAAFR